MLEVVESAEATTESMEFARHIWDTQRAKPECGQSEEVDDKSASPEETEDFDTPRKQSRWEHLRQRQGTRSPEILDKVIE